MNTQGIFLCWITVKDIKKAIKFYTEVAGLHLKEFDENFKWAELAGPNGSVLGIAQENLEYDQHAKAGQNAVVTLTVDNLDTAKKHFGQKGTKLVGDTIEIPGHVKMQTFADADGNTMQLVEMLSK